VWLENRRVVDILHSIESSALTLREHPAPDLTSQLDDTAPAIVLPMERPLYTPKEKVPLDSAGIAAAVEDVDASALFEQVYVDRERLCGIVRRELRERSQVGLSEVLARRPLEQGMAELVGYLSLGDPAFQVVFDETTREQVRWLDATGVERVATVPRVTFIRASSAGTVGGAA
jgi:hypothetical protein